MIAKDVTELDVYQKSFQLQQQIYELTKAFPVEERYSMTDQIRRSSRAVGANICEAWRKKRYEAYFRSKLSDADGEQEETCHWLRTAVVCAYLDKPTGMDIAEKYRHVSAMLNIMMNDAKIWCKKPV